MQPFTFCPFYKKSNVSVQFFCFSLSRKLIKLDMLLEKKTVKNCISSSNTMERQITFFWIHPFPRNTFLVTWKSTNSYDTKFFLIPTIIHFCLWLCIYKSNRSGWFNIYFYPWAPSVSILIEEYHILIIVYLCAILNFNIHYSN